jgi:hypothetical protein
MEISTYTVSGRIAVQGDLGHAIHQEQFLFQIIYKFLDLGIAIAIGR